MSDLSDKFEAFWILDEHAALYAPSVRVDSTINAHNWDISNAEWTTGPCAFPYSIFYHGGTAQQLLQATSAGLSLGSFDWEINGWAISLAGGPAGAECYIGKSLGFPSPLCYAVYQSAPAPYTLTLQVRDAANTTTGTASVLTGIASDTWFNWGAYHVSGSRIGVYVNAGVPTEATWTGGVLTNAGDVFTTIQAYMTGRKGFNHFNMGVARTLFTQSEREYLAGFETENCPPIWPFDGSPSAGIAFEARAARIQSGLPYTDATYGRKTYLIISSPVTGTERKVSEPFVDLDGVEPGEKIALNVRRDGDDPNDPSDVRCSLEVVSLDYYTKTN